MVQSGLETGLCNTQFPAQPGTTAHLDYLTVALPWRSVLEGRRLWKHFISHATLEVERGKRAIHGGVQTYDDSFKARDGAVSGGFSERTVKKKVKGFSPTPDKEVRFFARFSGKYFAGMDADQQYEFLCQLRAAGFNCTRIDLALDVEPDQCPFTMEDIDSAWTNGNFTRFGRKDRVSSGKSGNVTDSTYYFGSRLSAKLLRIYLHDGTPRLELECKAGAARKVFESLTDFDPQIKGRDQQLDKFLTDIAAYVMGCTEFKSRADWDVIESGGRKKLRAAYRSQHLDWWLKLQSLVGCGVKKIVGYGTAIPSYSRTVAWIERQVIKSLWLLQEFNKRTGGQDIWEQLKGLVNKREERLSVRDRRRLRVMIAERSMNDYPSPSTC